MPVGAILGVGAVASSVLGARSASRAAGAQEDASEAAIEEQRRQFNQTREDLAPARHAGRNALSMMQGLNGIGEMPAFNRNGRELGLGQDDDGWFLNRRDGSDWRRTNVDFDNRAQADRFIDSRRAGFEESPGYQYRVEEGQKALERMASARGIRMGGATMTEAMRRGEGMAGAEFGNYYNRLAGMAGQGQGAVNTGVNAGMQTSANIGNALQAGGQARASGYQGVNNALQGGINNGFNIYGMHTAGMFQ